MFHLTLQLVGQGLEKGKALSEQPLAQDQAFPPRAETNTEDL